jgi:hypothetical protein
MPSRKKNSPKKAIKVLTPQEIRERENKLKLSLREAEAAQLKNYLNHRSTEVDSEIDDIRQKLHLTLDSPQRKLPINRSPNRFTTSDSDAVSSYDKVDLEVQDLLKRLDACLITLLHWLALTPYRYARFSNDPWSDYPMLSSEPAYPQKCSDLLPFHLIFIPSFRGLSLWQIR